LESELHKINESYASLQHDIAEIQIEHHKVSQSKEEFERLNGEYRDKVTSLEIKISSLEKTLEENSAFTLESEQQISKHKQEL
jgi:hypothetical protein